MESEPNQRQGARKLQNRYTVARTRNRSTTVAKVADLCGLSAAAARTLLEAAGWSVTRARSLHFVDGGASSSDVQEEQREVNAQEQLQKQELVEMKRKL